MGGGGGDAMLASNTLEGEEIASIYLSLLCTILVENDDEYAPRHVTERHLPLT